MRLETVALFGAALILAELFQRSDERDLPDPVEEQPFSAPSAVHLAAALVLGPWVGALLAASGALGVRRLQGGSWRAVGLRAGVVGFATFAGGIAFGLAGGDSGSIGLPDGLVPVVVLALVYTTAKSVLLGLAAGSGPLQPELLTAVGESGLGLILALSALDNVWNLLAAAPGLLLVDRAFSRAAAQRQEVAHALETFANIVDERDPSTYRHSIRVAGYVHSLAAALRLPPGDVDRLRWAGRLHDLGKLAVDGVVLRKPGRLDDGEWAAVRRAPRLSARLLQRFRFAAQQARAVEFHRERYDGSGYYGVGGDDLPLASHFLIVADSFDAMTTQRPFRETLTHEAALAEIERNSGTQFHPGIAKAFVAVQRGIDPADVLSDEELAELREASAPYRLPPVPGAGDFKERPQLLALGGVVVALVGIGLGVPELAVAGGALTALGAGLWGLRRLRAARLTASLQEALAGAADDRERAFEVVAAHLDEAVTWSGLVSWQEHGTGGTLELERGEHGPAEAPLVSWLVREGESREDLLAAPGFELGIEGGLIALPLRRDNSALVGFLVLAGRRRLPGHVELALRSSIDALGLALAGRPDAPASRRGQLVASAL